jgi:hypothetical protein
MNTFPEFIFLLGRMRQWQLDKLVLGHMGLPYINHERKNMFSL